MKVTPGNNQRMVIVSIISIVILFFLWLTKINGVTLDSISYYGLHLIYEAMYLAMLWYLISILQFSGESVSVQTPFTIFLGVGLVNALILMVNVQTGLIAGTGALVGIITIYTAIYTFRVKHHNIKRPFRILGIALLVALLLKISLVFLPIPPGKYVPGPDRFIGLINLIPLLAILYILLQTRRILKAEPVSSSE